jgi:hypothetical protein
MTSASLLALACLALASQAEPSRFGVELDLESGERLLGYAWDGGRHVPFDGVTAPARVEYGELGVDEHTLAYLPLNAGSGAPRDVGPAGWKVRAEAAEWAAGRFGAGLRLRPGASLVLGGDAAPLFGDTFTIGLRLRVARAPKAGAVVLDLPGLFELRIDRQGHAAVAIGEPRTTFLVSKVALEPETWHRVAVAVDGRDLRQLRLTVDDTAVARRLDAAFRGPERIVVGGPNFDGVVDDLCVESVARSTAELIDRGRPEPAPGRRALELRLAGGTRELLRWAGTTTQPRLRTEADWNRGELVHARATADGLRWTAGHWERVRTTHRPVARTTHPTIHVGDGRVFVYGGETRDSHVWPMVGLDDTWIFHTREGRWERVATDAAPSPRCHQGAAYSPRDDVVLYPGGAEFLETGKMRSLSDTWLYHVGERRWERRFPAGVGHGPLSNSGVTYHAGADVFLIFTSRTVETYSVSQNLWTRRRPVADIDVYGSVMTGYDPRSRRVVLFGGEKHADGRLQYFDKTYLYDFGAHTFDEVVTERAPSPRTRSAFAYDGKRGRFVLFGGVQDQYSERAADLWSFSVEERAWRRWESSNAPSQRGGYYGMAYDPDLDRFFVLCGRHAVDRFLDEAWSLELDETARGTARYVFDRSSFGALTQLVAGGSTPGDSAIELSFRGATQRDRFGEWAASPARDARWIEVAVELRPGTGGEVPVLRELSFAARPETPSSATGEWSRSFEVDALAE